MKKIKSQSKSLAVPFIKMHGIGNDFVVIDNRELHLKMTADKARDIADRKFGIGCDQLVLIEKSKKADCFMRIFNNDGSEVDSCGNASRCVAYLLFKENGKSAIKIETKAGILECKKAGAEQISVNMGKPKLEWQEIPLAKKTDTLHLGIGKGPLFDPAAVSMGNPHAVFFVPDINMIDLDELGPIFESHPLFPKRANIGIAQIKSPANIALRVFERGAGETLACGTGACAALVAANRRGLIGRKATLSLKGGNLKIEWQKSGDVLMTGPATISFAGIFSF